MKTPLTPLVGQSLHHQNRTLAAGVPWPAGLSSRDSAPVLGPTPYLCGPQDREVHYGYPSRQ